jgi:heme exporter protein D
MIQNFLSMNDYGLFVWGSFAITFIACGLLYYKTFKTLKKHEREFAKEINELSSETKENSYREFKNSFTSFILI